MIETPLSKWDETLKNAKKGLGPWPLPVGHRVFTHPEEYNAKLVNHG